MILTAGLRGFFTTFKTETQKADSSVIDKPQLSTYRLNRPITATRLVLIHGSFRCRRLQNKIVFF